MPSPRPTPFDLAFGPLADERFPPIQAALEAAGQDPSDRDGFLMIREVIELIRELRPDEGLGEGIAELAAFLHHAYLFWRAGTPTLAVVPAELAAALRAAPADPAGDPAPPSFYAQLPERRVWASVVVDGGPEPMDGCFLVRDDDALRVLGAFGLRPDRMGLSVVEVTGARPRSLARPDATLLFAPTLAGGAAAGLASIVGAEELLELGWRLYFLAAERSR